MCRIHSHCRPANKSYLMSLAVNFSLVQDSKPPKDSFKGAPAYYGTALHELTHWSGHPSRLNRQTLTDSYRFGDINYAKKSSAR